MVQRSIKSTDSANELCRETFRIQLFFRTYKILEFPERQILEYILEFPERQILEFATRFAISPRFG